MTLTLVRAVGNDLLAIATFIGAMSRSSAGAEKLEK